MVGARGGDSHMLSATIPRRTGGAATPFSQLLADAIHRDPDAALVIDETMTLSRQEVARQADQISRRLIQAGVGAGDVVAIQLPNRARTVAVFHAVWRMGAIPCAVTPIYRQAELVPIFAAARPAALVVPRSGEVDYPAMVTSALHAAGHQAAIVELDLELDFEPDLDSHDGSADIPGSSEQLVIPDSDPDDIALLMFTSGTTGRPKGVLHSHRTLEIEARSIADVFALGQTNIFMPSPLGHVTGLLYGILLPLLIDGSVVLSDRWDADAAAEVIEATGCRFTVAATPFLRGLTDAYRCRGTTSTLEVFVCGGADIPSALVRDAEEVMDATVCRAYGSTELPTLSVVRPDDAQEIRLETEGRPIGGRARLVEQDGDIGDLEADGPELFVGYLDPSDNDAAFTDDGWFRTGDLARISPSGAISIVGRRKDLIVRGGENISAKEVEDLLLGHAKVDDVAVVGIPDDVMGERACAVLICTQELTLADLTTHLKSTGIARQKFPEALWRVPSFPRTVSGKVQKFQLRRDLLSAIERGEVELRER